MSMATRILLVDDVSFFRELGAVFLARSGPVDLAGSASDAFQSASQRNPRVVIADMHLPDLSGAELCRRFKAAPEFGEPRVVLLARPDSGEDHAEAVRAGADEVLFKPLERDVLIASVRRLTDFETPRGLPRARIEQSVAIKARGTHHEGKAINVSRGGLFVEAPVHFRRREEISLSFSLDGNGSVVSPTAQVIRSDSIGNGRDGIGLRFLEIDRQMVSKLERYVSDHFPRTASIPG